MLCPPASVPLFGAQPTHAVPRKAMGPRMTRKRATSCTASMMDPGASRSLRRSSWYDIRVCCKLVGEHAAVYAFWQAAPLSIEGGSAPPAPLPQMRPENICHTQPPACAMARMAAPCVCFHPAVRSRTSCLLRPMSSRQCASSSDGPVLQSLRFTFLASAAGSFSGPSLQSSLLPPC